MRTGIFFLILIPLILFSQSTTIRGTVNDGSSGEPLPAANLQIEGTYRGTITNSYGEFLLEVEKFPVNVLVTFIGYEKKRVVLKQLPAEPITVALKPVILETEPILVTAEDPGMGIMRKVIARKQLWFDSLKTYKVDAYSRMTLSNDSGIVSVMESLSEKYWHHEKGAREIVKARKQTENVESNSNFAFSVDFPNFYEDDIRIQGFNMVGPTHPDAFDYYTFKLKDRRGFDGDTVFVIEVKPTALLNPTFVGSVSVLDSVFALLAVDLKPNPETVIFPPPIQKWDVSYEQQFSNFGGPFWLPVDVRNDGQVKIALPGLDFPSINYQRSSRLTDYELNISLPDTLFEEGPVVRQDSIAIASDTLLSKRLNTIPLTRDEELAYKEVDSTDTFEKAFKPTGMLAGFIEDEEAEGSDTTSSFLSGFSPDLNYNRVEEAHLGISYENDIADKVLFDFGGHYATGLQRGGWDAEAEWRALRGEHDIDLRVEAGDAVTETYRSPNYHPVLAGAFYLFGLPDYYDYQENRYSRFALHYDGPGAVPELTLSVSNESQRSVTPPRLAEFNVLFRERDPRINPAIDDGFVRSLGWQVQYGSEYIPFGLASSRGLLIKGEHSLTALDSDFEYARYQLEADWYFDTFLQRRILPNRLYLRLVAGTLNGDLPLQKLGLLDASVGPLSPFGVFRAKRGRPYLGEEYVGLFWEHNFRSMFFELLGWHWPARKFIGIVLHGAHGRSWLSDNNLQKLSYGYSPMEQWHHEIGLSLNGLGYFRLDVTRRLDRPATYLGFGLFRWF